MPVSVADLRRGEYAPEPWTQNQVRFARSHATARILKGHPGSGKTTALLHAADATHAERVLYLTFSAELAGLARDYFDKFCSKERTFTVLTFQAFLRQIVDWKAGIENLDEARAQFRRDLFNHQKALREWAGNIDALWGEMHAHLVGAALPEASGRFPKAHNMCLAEKAYSAQRAGTLGPAGPAVLDAARRLERMGQGTLADRYFPELASAWRAASKIISEKGTGSFPNYGCIAVDEVQDLTPLEAFVVLSLARKMNLDGGHCPLLLAGDEAQTVRATDFEWAWLNDMLHTTVSQPQEFKLPVNRRSPKRIADLVNRAWDYYDYLHKQDRPSGAGYAEIEDDSPDQVLYAAVAAGELGQLLTEFSTHEGLAMIAFDTKTLPAETLPFVLTPQQAKGLDFNSVCVVNGGELLQRIIGGERGGQRVEGVLALERRNAIDQLRVALSRPTERLIWIDAASNTKVLEEASRFLGSAEEGPLHPISVEALRACLDEEELDVEERIQRCQTDALQLIDRKPDLAWSRAHQAVALLGNATGQASVKDPAARSVAYLTLAQVCFSLGIRKKNLSPELGRPNLLESAATAARRARKNKLANSLGVIGEVENSAAEARLNAIAQCMTTISEAKPDLPGWFLVELPDRANGWIEELERHLEAGSNAVLAQILIPPFVDAIGFPDAEARKERLARRSVQILVKNRRYKDALTILEKAPESQPELLALCYEESGQQARAAKIYLERGDREKAPKCYRVAAEFQSALELVKGMEGHAAKASLEWVEELDALLARRPESFNRVLVPQEKVRLEGMLERALGVQRKKPAPRKAAAPRKKATPRKTATPGKTAGAKKTAAPKAPLPGS
jgi:tetratricopeptide (TPR) repeat protein